MTRRTACVDQACSLTGVSRRTIYNWIKAGKVEYVRTAGGSMRIFVDTLFRRGNVPVDTIAQLPVIQERRAER